jgi:small subunit ribosomal protein S6
MPLYEHVFLARQDLAQAQVDALAQAATDIIEAMAARSSRPRPGACAPSPTASPRTARRITSPRFRSADHVVAELERQTQINEDVIRYMTVRVDAHEKGPSAMMRRNERDSRDGRGDGDRGDRGRSRPPPGSRRSRRPWRSRAPAPTSPKRK